MTFKEARAQARTMGGACVGRFKDGGWFATREWRDARNFYYVRRDGALLPLNDKAKKFLEKRKKPLDK